MFVSNEEDGGCRGLPLADNTDFRPRQDLDNKVKTTALEAESSDTIDMAKRRSRTDLGGSPLQ